MSVSERVERRPAVRALRLAYVTSRSPFTAAEPFLLPEARALAARVEECWIVPMRPCGPVVHADAAPLLERTLREGLVSPRLLVAAGAELLQRPRQSGRPLRRLGASRSARVLAKNAVVAPKALWLARRLRDLGADHVHVHWGGASSTLALLAAEAAGLPWSLTLHRWDIGEDNLLAAKLRSASFVRAISADGAERVRRLVPGAAVEVIHLGIEPPAGSAEPRRDADSFRLLAAGALVPVKGYEALLEAIARLERGPGERRFRLDIAGEGPLRARLEERTRELGIADRVRLLGLLPHPELLRRLGAGEWDAVVHSSLDLPELHEGIPVSLMEAMAAGLPVVALQSGGVAELVRPGAGLLVEDRDPARLAAAIDLLARDPELAARLAAAGRALVREEFDTARTTELLLERIEAATPARAVARR